MGKRILMPDQPSIGDVKMMIHCGSEIIYLKRGNGDVVTWILENPDEDTYIYKSIDMTSKEQFQQLWELIDSWSTGVKRC